MLRNLMFTLIFAILLFAGCSGGNAPVMPSGNDEIAPVITADVPDGGVVRGDATLGIWEVEVNLDSLDADYHMVRRGFAIGQSLPECLLNTYLTVTPCTTCMRLDVVKFDPATNRITLSIGLRHPLIPFNPGLPITASNRADLDVFNVMGIIILPATTQADFSYLINGTVPVQVDPYTMTNADGYTHSLHDVVTDPTFINPNYGEPISTLNPFKYYFSTSQNRRFAQGEQFQMIDYVFDLSKITNFLRFYIAFRASYGQSASFAKSIQDPAQPGSRGNPLYFIPEFNQVDSYDMVVEQLGTLEYQNAASQAEFRVKCKDYQAGRTGLGRYIMETDPLDSIAFTSDVEKVVLDIPAVSGTPFVTTAPISGTGGETDPYVFSFNVQNNLAATFGTYPFLVAIEDSRLLDPVDVFQVGHLHIPYIDDFDPYDEFLGWKVVTYRGEGWTMVNSGVNGNVWDESDSGSYGDEDSTRLTSPVIDLTWSTDSPYMEITHLYATEFLWDGGSVFLSLDGGITFDYSQEIPVLPGGKQYDTVMAGVGISDTVLMGRWGFSGNSGGEVSTQFDLSKAAHRANVAVQFVFESNHVTNNIGWEIRKIKIIP